MSNFVDDHKSHFKQVNMINRFTRSHEVQSNPMAAYQNVEIFQNVDNRHLIKRQNIRTHSSSGNINYALDTNGLSTSCNNHHHHHHHVNHPYLIQNTNQRSSPPHTSAHSHNHCCDALPHLNSNIYGDDHHNQRTSSSSSSPRRYDNCNTKQPFNFNNANDTSTSDNPFLLSVQSNQHNVAECCPMRRCLRSNENVEKSTTSPCSQSSLFYLQPNATKQSQLNSANLNAEFAANFNQLSSEDKLKNLPTHKDSSVDTNSKQRNSLLLLLNHHHRDSSCSSVDKTTGAVETNDKQLKPHTTDILESLSIISSGKQQQEAAPSAAKDTSNTFEPLQVSAVNKSNYGSCLKRNQPSLNCGEQSSQIHHSTSVATSQTFKFKPIESDNNVVGNSLVAVRNNAMDWNDVTRRYGKRPSHNDDIGDKIQASCCCGIFLTWLTTIFPILTAFNDYNLPTDLITDLFAGFTIAVLHIPQGMAYGLLAGTDPIYGLYVSLIPVMIISFLGTSKHVSYGTFAIISIMLSNSIANVNQIFDARLKVANHSSSMMGYNDSLSVAAPPPPLASVFDITNQLESMMDAIVVTDNHKSPGSASIGQQPLQQQDQASQRLGQVSHDVNGDRSSIAQNADNGFHHHHPSAILAGLIERPEPIEILTTICLLVGIIQLSMALFKLGMLSLVFSDQLVSSFTTACAVQVFTAQLDVLFDINLPPVDNGLFATCRIWYTFAENLISGSNKCVVIMSALSLAYLMCVKSLLEPWLKRRIYITTLPSEILLMIVTTLVSYYFELHENYGVNILGSIPTGLPSFKPPRTDLIEYVVSDSITIAVISFALNLSIVQIYAKKYRQKVDANQELFSIGTANLVSSFFWCFPCAASLSRSSVQSNLGVRSPLATLFGCSILVCIICYWAPLLYYLPTSTLACIIIVALRGILCQVSDLINNWKLSKIDSLVWIITFLSVIIAGVTYGLIVGVATTLSTIFYRLLTPNYSILGCLPGTELYLEASSFAGSVEIPYVKIFRFNSALCYLNRTMFKAAIERSIPDIFQKNTSISCFKKIRSNRHSLVANIATTSPPTQDEEKTRANEIKFLIIDCSALSYCDFAGADQLTDLIEELADHKVHVYLAACPMNMIIMFEKMRKHSIIANNIYPSIHDAVNQSRILCAFRSDISL